MFGRVLLLTNRHVP